MSAGTAACNWCQTELTDPFTSGGLYFCDEDCAELYEAEWGSEDPFRCPACGSPEPRLHPAISDGGEVTRLCPHPFHDAAPVDERVRRIFEQGPQP